ncbi:MAG: ABC transporter ATP-binding protein [Verrucomicrobiota bacterium]
MTKKFGSFTALEGFELEVGRGDCVGLLGPNGAGKSTFIGCLYGVVRRTSGELLVFGLDPASDDRAIKRRIGVVPQENALDEGLTVVENMQLYARFEGLGRANSTKRIEELLGYMALDKKRNAEIRTLSGGMKRRLTFVRALLSNPELLILDEPTTGLDPSVRHLLWDTVADLRKEGRTVLVTTHYMHEAEALCDRIVVMNNGRFVANGKPRELIDRETPGYVGIFPGEGEATLRRFANADWEIYPQGEQFCVRAPRFDDLIELQKEVGLEARQLRPTNLEDVYLKLTGRVLEEDDNGF